jgi:hypothetical protein
VDVLRDFPRRTRISVFAFGAFFDFARKKIFGFMSASVVIPVLRAHFEPVNYGSMTGRLDLFVVRKEELMERSCWGGTLRPCDATDLEGGVLA